MPFCDINELVRAVPPAVQRGTYEDVPDPTNVPAFVAEKDTSVGVMVIAIPVEAVNVLYSKVVPVMSDERKAFAFEMNECVLRRDLEVFTEGMRTHCRWVIGSWFTIQLVGCFIGFYVKSINTMEALDESNEASKRGSVYWTSEHDFIERMVR